MGIASTLTAAAATNRTCTAFQGLHERDRQRRKWCEDGTDGSNRGNVLDDCVQRRRVVEPEQTRHNAQAHYDAVVAFLLTILTAGSCPL